MRPALCVISFGWLTCIPSGSSTNGNNSSSSSSSSSSSTASSQGSETLPKSNQPDSSGYNASMLLDHLLLGYDSRLRPNFGGPATLVDVNLNIRSMGPISESDMAYQMDLYFRQGWVDKRLEFNYSSLTMLPVSIKYLERLWKPDTHFFNGQRSYLHTVTTPNKLLRIGPDGRILYSMRLTVKASCPMHLESFPMDRQTCPLKFGSHGYTSEEMLYVWTHGPANSIKMASDMTLSQFDLIGFPAGNETLSQPARGPVSVLVVHFAMRRHMGYFLINVYVPCSLLVILSWVAFWINREATADRIALGITTVLTMAFLSIDNRHDLPKVSYSTALDYFVGACFTFVLATIIQFAGVHFFTKHGSGEIQHASDSEDEEDDTSLNQGQPYHFVNRHTRSPATRRTVVTTARSNGETSVSLQYEPELQQYDTRESCLHKFWKCLMGSSTYRRMKMKTSKSGGINSVSSIDRMARVLFPLAFVTFNVLYWFIYLNDDDSAMIM